jgi:putative DNA primase/helicase
MPPFSAGEIPQELKERSQWVNWNIEIREAKETKIPYQPNGQHARANDPTTWTSFETACQALKNESGFDGVGFVFSDHDDYAGLDFDNCVDPITGEIMDAQVEQWVRDLDSYTEYSQSLSGLHVIIKGRIPGPHKRQGNVEMYHTGRYFCMTGQRYDGTPASIESHQDALNELYNKLFGSHDEAPHINTPCELHKMQEMPGQLRDSDVIRKASGAKNGDKFMRLFVDGDTSDYNGDDSAADMALCGLLRFWCGGDATQIDRIFRRSALFRGKWDERHGELTYGEMTIDTAIKQGGEMYAPCSNGIEQWWRSGEKKKNQEDLAALFVEEYKDRLCYSYELNRWQAYNGAYWEIDVSGGRTALVDFINDVIATINATEPPVFDGENANDKLAKWNGQRDKWLAWAIKQNNAYAQDGILRIARDKAGVSLSEFDKDDWLLNCKNGTIDLKTGELVPHDPQHKITLMVPVDYNPEASYERWDQFLTEAVGRPQYIRFLQKEVGCCLTGSTANEIIIILYGGDTTGKSTFYEPIMLVLGVPNSYGYGHYMGLNTLKHAQGEGNAPREDLLRLRTCRAVMCSEINPETKFDTALIKKIASGEPIVARGLYASETVEFLPRFKVILGTNYMPRIPYDDGGTYRRFKVNPFVHKVENVDETLKADFCTNPEAKERILAWLVEGFLLWQREGLNDVPHEVERANADYRRSQSPLSGFLEDFCILDRFADSKTPLTRIDTMLTTYNDHCALYGGEPLSKGAFGKYMKAAHFEGYHTHVVEHGMRLQVRGYNGIRLKTLSEIQDGCGFNDVEEAYDREERQPFEMLLRYMSRYGEDGSGFALLGSFENLKEKSREDICEMNTEVFPNCPNIENPEPSQQEAVNAVRDVMVAWHNASSDRDAPKVNRTHFVDLVAATVRRQHPEFAGRDIERDIKRLAETDPEIQTLLAELTDAEV